MRHMSFEHPDDQLPVEKAASVAPWERQNERNLIQHALMARSPEGDFAWAERYAKQFGTLFDTDHDFSDLVREAHATKYQSLLTRIQERLDQD